jgi:SAM-dependent methyltransferase
VTCDSREFIPVAPNRVIPEDWYERSFDALYPVLYAHRTVEAAEGESRFAAEKLQLRRDDRVLDLACGNGRHLVHLRACGAAAVGLDYSHFLLSEATRILGSPRDLVRADMRAIPFDEAFDAVVNFFTSFGYFTDRQENLCAVKNVAGALKPAGRFFIDYISSAHAERNLVPLSRRVAGGIAIEEARWIDYTSRRINKCTIVTSEAQPDQRFAESVQLYSRDEFVQLLGEGGLRVTDLYGDYSGAPWDETQPRMIAVGVKA